MRELEPAIRGGKKHRWFVRESEKKALNPFSPLNWKGKMSERQWTQNAKPKKSASFTNVLFLGKYSFFVSKIWKRIDTLDIVWRLM